VHSEAIDKKVFRVLLLSLGLMVDLLTVFVCFVDQSDKCLVWNA